ncbi:MAG: AAA family ATPase [Gammaproteobacteria bacterium]|nr:AAA family ATPase [Gammaproteobacteria bacterium]
MSRLNRFQPVLEAAQKWKQRCLIEGRSVFGEEPLWSVEHFEELYIHFVQRPDAGNRSFVDKLKDQLANTTPQAKCLWAEITWIFWLLVRSVRRESKIQQIRLAWDWASKQLPLEHWALQDVLSQGVVNPGPAYQIQRDRELSFVVTLMRSWFALPENERESLLDDPWVFAKWVDSNEGAEKRQFRHVLLFLLFPDEFEPSVVSNHKQKIVQTYGQAAGQSLRVEDLDLVGLDKALLATRKHLERENPGDEIHFYDNRFRNEWSNGATLGISRTSDDEWYSERFGSADVWLVAAGMGANMWDEFLGLGVFGIPWDYLGDINGYESKDAIRKKMVEHGIGENPVNDVLGAWEFLTEVKIGDVFLVRGGLNTILAFGTVKGNCSYGAGRRSFKNIRSVEWQLLDEPISVEHQIAVKTLTRFTSYKSWLRDLFEKIDGKGEPDPYTIERALDALFLEPTQFQRIVDSIELRKNLILQGPPGVGKTFIARRIAWCVIKQKMSESIEMVQFHQSYSYEDFVQGWRPTETGGFTLRNGVFYEFCKAAEQQPEVPFVFIIDEINRGNLSRIFGELLMLIEGDKRGFEHEIALTYSQPGERFSVPENVYILGLMNTADRSLAIVDYALRRRFAFETLIPAFGTEKFREYLMKFELSEDLIERINTNMIDLNEQICGHQDLGPGFQIGHSYFVPETPPRELENWYQSIITTQIEPLLHEYWFDHPEDVEKAVERLRL